MVLIVSFLRSPLSPTYPVYIQWQSLLSCPVAVRDMTENMERSWIYCKKMGRGLMCWTLDRGYVYRCRKRVNVDVVKIAHDRPTLTSSTRHPTRTVLYILCNWATNSSSSFRFYCKESIPFDVTILSNYSEILETYLS